MDGARRRRGGFHEGVAARRAVVPHRATARPVGGPVNTAKPFVPSIAGPVTCDVVDSVIAVILGVLVIMFGENVVAKIIGKIPPRRMNVIGVVLGVGRF